jgi:hypothetical protein
LVPYNNPRQVNLIPAKYQYCTFDLDSPTSN